MGVGGGRRGRCIEGGLKCLTFLETCSSFNESLNELFFRQGGEIKVHTHTNLIYNREMTIGSTVWGGHSPTWH